MAAPVATEMPVRQFDKRRVGESLERLRTELIACGRELRSTQALLQGSSFVDDALDMLDRLTCRIGVIGQVKAGKSSLINGLMGRPGLLPTDVNPWTTAVTRIHFGRADAPAAVAAEFTFFEPDEWQQLAHGGGQLRDLTQRLVPGFKVELLHKHVEAMRQRAESRLGASLDQLLGKTHVFSLLSPEILERYICASLPDSADDRKGVYSDIIKTADLYFGSSDFGFPTTVIDTPGTNDPYLVRDELARRTLESAHLHIVVLTPQQALAPADLALLRILRGLNKNRIVVFLNRIDQLGDITRDVEMVVKHIRDHLHHELPGADFPIVAGSAFWADTALRGAPADIERAFKKARPYAQHVVQQARFPLPAGAGRDDKEALAQNLFLCSGLPELFDVLARLTLASHPDHVLQRVAKSFCDVARIAENAATHELRQLEEEQKPKGDKKQEEDEEELQAVDAEIKAMLSGLKERGEGLIKERGATIEEALRSAKQIFSDAECDKLRKATAQGQPSGRVWSCDLTLLRQQLEEALVGAYREAEQDMATLESEVLPELQKTLQHFSPQWTSQTVSSAAPMSIELPTIGTPSIVLELDEPWWMRWWRRGQASERRAAALARLIDNEFSAIAGPLSQAARTHLRARQESTLKEANLLYVGLIDVLKEQSRARQSAASLEQDLLHSPELQRMRESRIADLRKQETDMGCLADRLANMSERIAETPAGSSSAKNPETVT
jgi:hypothetical protein